MRWLDALLEVFVALQVVILVAIVAAQLVDRHLFDLPIAAPDQYARIALIWLTFIGFALALRADVNIRVDLVDARLSPRIRRVFAIAFDAILLALLILLVVKGWRLVAIGVDQMLLGTPLSAAVPASALLVAALLMILFVALRLVLRVAGREPSSRVER
jgi:TRAP-type transport system small permease protein